MKKSIVVLAIVSATLLGGCQSGQQSDAQSTTAAPIPTPAITQVAPTTQQTATQQINEQPLSEIKPITEATAKATALADAGLTEADVTFTECKQDLHDGFQVYEIEFVSGNTEYNYTIDLSTGSILEKEQENENDND